MRRDRRRRADAGAPVLELARGAWTRGPVACVAGAGTPSAGVPAWPRIEVPGRLVGAHRRARARHGRPRG